MTEQLEWAALFEEYHQELYRFARAMLGSEAEAEDVLQDTYISAYYSLKKTGGIQNIRGWLYRITRNACIDRQRWWRRTLKTIAHLEAAEREDLSQLEARSEVMMALQQLSRRQREIFILRHWQGFSTAETAELLGISVGSVKSHLKRAVDQMKVSLLR